MAKFEIKWTDGKTYEVEAPDQQAAINALSSLTGGAGGVSVNSQAVSELGDQLKGVGLGAFNGATLGWGDEMAGGMAALGGIFAGDVNTPEQYDAEEARVRDGIRGAYDQAPDAARTFGNIVGGIVPAVAAAPATAGAPWWATMGRLAGLGAVEGGLTGAGNADGADMGRAAFKGGLIGLGLGAGAVPVVSALRAGGRAVGGLAGIGNEKRAGTAIAHAMRRGNTSLNDLARILSEAAADGQPMFRTADALGVPGQRMLAGVARSPGEAKAEIAAYLNERQAGQGDRIADFVTEALGTPDTAAQRAAALKQRRSDIADPNYAAARDGAGPVDVRGALAVIDERVDPTIPLSADSVQAALKEYRDRLSVTEGDLPDGVTSMDLSDFQSVLLVKQDLQDDIETAYRAGRNNTVRELKALEAELDAALEAASPGYRTANDTFRRQSRVIDAIETGRDAARPGRQADALDAYRRLGAPNTPALPDEPAFGTAQQAFRSGYADPLMARIENSAPGVNKARMLSTPKNTALMGEMADDPLQWQRRLDRENTMFETRADALGGSKTADNLADQADVSGKLITDALLSPKQAALGAVVRAVGNAATGQNEKTRLLIARALLSADPTGALQPLLGAANGAERTARIIEALIRQGGYEGALR